MLIFNILYGFFNLVKTIKNFNKSRFSFLLTFHLGDKNIFLTKFKGNYLLVSFFCCMFVKEKNFMKNNKQLLRTFFNKEKCFEKFFKNFYNEEQIEARKNIFHNNQSIYNLKDFINDYANGSLIFIDRKVSMETFFSHSFMWRKTVEGSKYWLEIGTKWKNFYENNV